MSKDRKNKSQKSNAKTKKSSPTLMWLGIAGILVVIIVAIVIFRPSTGSNTAMPLEISVQEAYNKYQQGTFVLDVRTPEEWTEFHAPNTTLIPLDELESRLDELPRDREIVVVCRSGNRSQQGRDILLGAGFEQVTSMAGGLNEWRSSGYPVISGP